MGRRARCGVDSEPWTCRKRRGQLANQSQHKPCQWPTCAAQCTATTVGGLRDRRARCDLWVCKPAQQAATHPPTAARSLHCTYAHAWGRRVTVFSNLGPCERDLAGFREGGLQRVGHFPYQGTLYPDVVCGGATGGFVNG